jgi:hypothetical protein
MFKTHSQQATTHSGKLSSTNSMGIDLTYNNYGPSIDTRIT